MKVCNDDLLNDHKDFEIETYKYSKKNTMAMTHYHTHYELYYQGLGDCY